MNNGSFLFLLILNLQDSQTEQVRVVKEMRFNTYLNLQDSQTHIFLPITVKLFNTYLNLQDSQTRNEIGWL